MKFEEALLIALAESREIAQAALMVAVAEKEGSQSAAYTFAIGDEAFTFGFDGCEIHRVKHNKKRSAYLIQTGQATIINPEATM